MQMENEKMKKRVPGRHHALKNVKMAEK